MLITQPAFLNGTISCSRYFVEICSSLLIVASEIGVFVLKVFASCIAKRTPYLSLVVSFPNDDIFCAFLGDGQFLLSQ